MKKTLFFGLIAAALGFTTCSSEDDAILGENIQKKGMVLNAIVEQPAETRATIDNSAATWTFAFAQNDQIKVTNSAVASGTYYTFTSNGTTFSSSDATSTTSAANWFAYYPSNSVTLTNQAGTMDGVANLYALAGATASATTGAEGLNISMSAKVAILKIENYKGAIDIQVKTSADNYVTGLTAKSGEAGFDVSKSTDATTLFTTSTTGTYYVAVPAGVQLSVKDGNDVLKSTKPEGLAAGKYYNLTIAAAATTTGTAAIKGGGTVGWVQLWAGGPKFAEKNVGASSVTDNGTTMVFTDAVKEGADYVWGANWCTPSKEDLDHLVIAAKGETDDKVKCEYVAVSGTYGFKFTGKEEGYTGNSVFFPAQSGGGDGGNAYYWSGTASGSNAWYMYLDYENGRWENHWTEGLQGMNYLVRPVLKN